MPRVQPQELITETAQRLGFRVLLTKNVSLGAEISSILVVIVRALSEMKGHGGFPLQSALQMQTLLKSTTTTFHLLALFVSVQRNIASGTYKSIASFNTEVTSSLRRYRTFIESSRPARRYNLRFFISFCAQKVTWLAHSTTSPHTDS